MPLDNQANLPVVLEAYTPKLHEGHFPAAGHSSVFSETAPARMTVYKIARSGCASNRKKEISCSAVPQTSAEDVFRWAFHEKVHYFGFQIHNILRVAQDFVSQQSEMAKWVV